VFKRKTFTLTKWHCRVNINCLSDTEVKFVKKHGKMLDYYV